MSSKAKQILITLASASALAAINYTIIHSPLVFVFTLVILAHELGHYFTAKKHKGTVQLPIFLPLPFLIIAFTKIKDLDLEGKKQTAIYGPITGFITSIFFLLINLIFKYTSSVPLVILSLSELVSNYFGSDGKKYRESKRKQSLCPS